MHSTSSFPVILTHLETVSGTRGRITNAARRFVVYRLGLTCAETTFLFPSTSLKSWMQIWPYSVNHPRERLPYCSQDVVDENTAKNITSSLHLEQQPTPPVFGCMNKTANFRIGAMYENVQSCINIPSLLKDIYMYVHTQYDSCCGEWNKVSFLQQRLKRKTWALFPSSVQHFNCLRMELFCYVITMSLLCDFPCGRLTLDSCRDYKPAAFHQCEGEGFWLFEGAQPAASKCCCMYLWYVSKGLI